MKVLFVASGNGKLDKASSFIMSQYHSLEEAGAEMEIFSVYGHGVWAYLSLVGKLRKVIKAFQPDIVHAHYSTSGFLATLAALGVRYQKNVAGETKRVRPKIFVAILGSYAWGSRFRRWRTRFFIRHIWDGALTKSQRTADELDVQVPIVPNGVNLHQFAIEPQIEARLKLGMKDNIKYVMFITNPKRPEKNFPLAQQAFNIAKKQYLDSNDEKLRMRGKHMELMVVQGLPHDQIVRYMCAGDIVLMTSTTEGSPNVIKEAMACNCPIVCTDVGDVPWLLEGVKGSFLVREYNAEAVANAIHKAIEFEGRTNGRDKIYQLELTTEQVAQRLISIYESILNDK